MTRADTSSDKPSKKKQPDYKKRSSLDFLISQLRALRQSEVKSS
ncbi:MAG: hypothetical protein TR69_WS6001000330 [candidate division WS6 bacterium OLB20]|uniref:Uncharacterized protein n=1 Tax=candidate division WS6 bacterium OLB20 TaxID=1617426 RepID=A0A136M0N2_9BACT|nr:MAG: hypothetical protein TR69_WS6001000330 [candidate division WS6 bacterium OLB20]